MDTVNLRSRLPVCFFVCCSAECICSWSAGCAACVRGEWGSLRRVPVPPRLLPDPARLESIAKAGGGQSFAANDGESLRRVFQELDVLEPHRHHVRSREDYADRFLPWLIACVACAGLALLGEPRLRGDG